MYTYRISNSHGKENNISFLGTDIRSALIKKQQIDQFFGAYSYLPNINIFMMITRKTSGSPPQIPIILVNIRIMLFPSPFQTNLEKNQCINVLSVPTPILNNDQNRG